MKPPLICVGCYKSPEELDCYDALAEEVGMTQSEYVWENEGTLNTRNGHFLCDDCYIKSGMPTAPYPGWKAP